jgi:hypothetical protein
MFSTFRLPAAPCSGLETSSFLRLKPWLLSHIEFVLDRTGESNLDLLPRFNRLDGGLELLTEPNWTRLTADKPTKSMSAISNV